MPNLEDDLTPFFNVNEHARAATLTVGVVTSDILVIFNRPMTDATGGLMEPHYSLPVKYTGLNSVVGEGPTALCRYADVLNAKPNDRLLVQGTNYYIATIDDDGTGLATLTLSVDPV